VRLEASSKACFGLPVDATRIIGEKQFFTTSL